MGLDETENAVILGQEGVGGRGELPWLEDWERKEDLQPAGLKWKKTLG